MAKQISFNDSRWGALNEAARLDGEPSKDGASLTHKSVGGTDWWRTTDRHSMDGPTLGFKHKIGGGFEISVDLNVEPNVQATIFLYVSPTQWVKAGIEYDNDALWNGAVVCNPYSDWSISKRSSSDSSRFTLSVTPNEVHVYLGDDMIREVKWFGPTSDNDAVPDAPGQSEVFVGIMACSPKEGGASVTWKNFTLKEEARAH